MLRTGAAALLILCAAAHAACANVKPWERGSLARPDMAWDPDPLEAQLDAHIRFSKEAALPGGSVGGGGCGCN